VKDPVLAFDEGMKGGGSRRRMSSGNGGQEGCQATVARLLCFLIEARGRINYGDSRFIPT
jgi:hypothetical protein